MSWVLIGRLGRPHGLDGELHLDGCALSVPELLALRDFSWRGLRGEARDLTLTAARPANARILVRFAGVGSREEASELTNGEIGAEPSQLPDAGPGMAYHFQIMGLEVRTAEGRVLGAISDIIATGAHPVYVVKGEREILIPGTPAIVQHVDLAARTMTVALPAGLEDAMA